MEVNSTTAEDIRAFEPRSVSAPQLYLVVIRATDPARLVRFYSALGLSFKTEQHGNGPPHYASTDSGITFEIYPRRVNEPATTGTRLGFATVALDTILNASTGFGGTIITPPSVSPWGRQAIVTDPEGHKVELTKQKDVRDVSG